MEKRVRLGIFTVYGHKEIRRRKRSLYREEPGHHSRCWASPFCHQLRDEHLLKLAPICMDDPKWRRVIVLFFFLLHEI